MLVALPSPLFGLRVQRVSYILWESNENGNTPSDWRSVWKFRDSGETALYCWV